jgi:Uma2 family endonuclease
VSLTIQLPAQEHQAAFNLRRWDDLQHDQQLARLPFTIETDRFGRIIMSPPPASDHTKRVGRILRQLHDLFPQGEVLAETAISTTDGVKVTDAAWLSAGRAHELDAGSCLVSAPEICIEVLSPSNSPAEMAEKRALYFEAGAAEVWICDLDGSMAFYTSQEQRQTDRSQLCPAFPISVPSRI